MGRFKQSVKGGEGMSLPGEETAGRKVLGHRYICHVQRQAKRSGWLEQSKGRE